MRSENFIEYKKVFVETKFIIECVFIIQLIYTQYFSNRAYLCDLPEYSCSLCGMRNAFDLFVSFQFADAYQSNPLIILVAILIFLFLIDVIWLVYQVIRKLKK